MTRTLVRSLVLLLTLTVLSACGGGTSGGGGGGGTTVTATLKDAGGNTVTATAGTAADPASFTVTFDQAMDAASLTTAGNVTLVCGSLTPSITIASVSETQYTIAVADAYKYQLLSCTLTLTANVKVAAGTAIEAQSFAFTINACAVSDDFNSDTQACWAVPPSNVAWTSWDALLNGGIFAFDIANSELDYANAQAGTTQAMIYKMIAVDPQGLEVTLTTNGLTGFDDQQGQGQGPSDAVEVVLMSAFSQNSRFITPSIFSGPADNTLYCCVVYSDDGGLTNAIMGVDCTSCSTERCQVRLTVSDGQLSGSYSIGGGAFQQMTDVVQGTFPTDDDFSDMTLLGLVFVDNGGDNRAAIDSISASGLTVSGQY